ncbi:MAG: cytochrome P450 [Candidatus Thermofonsia Clade 1 bacterium]|uniref:Cytochrome P450 n=1 Tax=Candidatus Thermofonsia Clade 1 bacterium TaxID=2364210 RepID=A0A2M8PG57_9CHLR|nr:MAG: cytochrome P450 [Candidatus Thermofonsia Clade 1 bacterium]
MLNLSKSSRSGNPAMKSPAEVRSSSWLGNVSEMSDALSFFSALAPRYGDVCVFRVFSERRFYVQNPDLIQQILTSHKWVRTPISRKLLGSFLGESVFSQEGELHLSQRRLIQPAFHRERLAHYAQTMVAQTAHTIAAWRVGEQRDLVDEMMRLTLEIVSQVLFGSSTSHEARQIGEALLIIQRSVEDDYRLAMLLPLWVPVIRFGKARRAVKVLQATTQRIIAERRAAPREHDDLLDMLLRTHDEDGSRLTDAQVCGQVLALLFAGHETTANALAWALYLLARHPHVLARLRAEVEAVCGDRLPSITDLPHLRYTEQVFKETLRLHPPAWYAERVPLEDFQLGDYIVPKGTAVSFSVYALQRDARYFEQPEAFLPERFAPENVGKIHRYAYLPFGLGAHQCIGNQFAMIEGQLILATLASRLALSLPSAYQPQIRALITYGISNGLPMTVVGQRAEPTHTAAADAPSQAAH